MKQQFQMKSLKARYARIEYSLKRLYREVWPINWSYFQKPKLIVTSFLNSPYPLKAFFLVTVVATAISIYFLAFGTYLVFTKEVPSQGGEIREALLNNELKVFNPVLDANSEGERKINSLLYHPLYTVTYPDYLADTQSLPTIKPILLTQEPQWQDLSDKPENRYRVLRFQLRKDIFWSDKKPITISDVEYSFEKLKESKANSDFKDVFSRVEFARISDTEFDLRSSLPNPQLIYSANFSPISKLYYENQNTDSLTTDFRSTKPTVTSGYFTFSKDQVRDPDSKDGALRDNPIRNEGFDGFGTVILSRNPVQNTGETILVDRYIFKNYQNFNDNGGSDVDSIQRASTSGKVDLFTRNLNAATNQDSQEVRTKLGLSQKVTGTNNFYNLYLNIRRSDIFINQTLRKYLMCNLMKYQIDQKVYPGLEDVPAAKRLIPIQLNQEFTPDCPENPVDVLDGKVYKLQEDTKTGVKRILFCGRRCVNINKLTLIGFADKTGLLMDIQTFLRDIGMPADLVDNPVEAQRRLESKEYSLAFLPITVVNRDPYPLFGARGRDISQIRLNNILDNKKIEDSLSAYSSSNLTDENSKKIITDFFAQEYVAMNMFRAKNELNFSSTVFNFDSNLPNFITFAGDVYRSCPAWYTTTKRQWK